MTDPGHPGQGSYVVAQGDCIDSIAFEHGHLWATIWNDSANSEIKKRRRDPNVLLPGDRIAIPELRTKEVSAATGSRHRFRRRGVPAKLRLRFQRYGKPRADVSYVALIDGTPQEGTLDANGELALFIPPNARSAKLILREGNQNQEFDLDLGHLDPIEEISGVQARLEGLGYTCKVDGSLGKNTHHALSSFQADHGLAESGEADERTLNELQKFFGS